MRSPLAVTRLSGALPGNGHSIADPLGVNEMLRTVTEADQFDTVRFLSAN